MTFSADNNQHCLLVCSRYYFFLGFDIIRNFKNDQNTKKSVVFYWFRNKTRFELKMHHINIT